MSYYEDEEFPLEIEENPYFRKDLLHTCKSLEMFIKGI